MVGKNNKFLKENKNNQRFLRFSLRKLSVGVVSVAIAAGFYIGGSQSVLADTTSTDPVVRQNAPNDDSTVNTDNNTVNQQSASTSADSSAVAGAADMPLTAQLRNRSAAPAAEKQKTAPLNVADAKPALNTADLLDNKAQSSAVSDAASTVNDDDLLKNIKISNPTDPNFVQYQDLVDSYMSYHYGEEKPSQYVFSVISDSRIDTDFIWTVDQDTGEKVSVYFFNNWGRITGYHQFINDDFDDNHNDYRYSKRGLFTLSYDKPEGSSGSISVVDDHHILNLGDANLQDVYEINGNTDNSRCQSITTLLPEKGQPIIKFLYRNPDTGKLMNLRDPIYYSNGLTGQKFELDIGDSYKQELKDMFAGFKLVGSSKARGTFTQFTQGKTYVERFASDDSEVIYQQIDAEGTMKVFYREKDGEKQPVLDTHGNPCQLEAGSSINFDTRNNTITASNPFVTGDHAYELIYEPEDQSANIVYVDKDGNKIKTDTVNGKTTQTVDVKSNVPAGWVLVKGQHDAPATITFTGAHTDDITIKIEHGKTSVDHNHPVTPGDKTPSGKEIKGAHDSDLNQTITRTIKVHEPGKTAQKITQTAKIFRDATVDEVTGEVTYGQWTTAEWSSYDVPAVPGYTPSQREVPATKVTSDTKDQTVTVTYTANDQTTTINYVDERGKVIHTTVVNGHTDQTVKVPTETPAGWTITKGQVPTEITFGPDGHADVTVTVGHQHVTVTSDQPKTSVDKLPDNPAKTYPNGVGHDDLNKTITRIVKVTTPAGQTKTVTQTAKLTRTADVDEVTGEVTYGQWTTAEWSSYDVPAVPGYTPSQREVPATKVTSDTKDQTVTVTYTANDQTTTINYVDERGKVIHTTVVNGHTDQTVKVPTETPAGWTITKGQVPTEITFGPNGHADVTVTVGHQHVTVTSDQPKTSVDKLPDNPAKTYPNGVGHDDLNKTITRIVKVTTPAGQTKTVTQTAKLTRTADVDEVTGEVTYGQWTTAEWSSYDVPAVPGYTPSQREVPATKVTSDTKDQTVTVTYTANDQTTTINYVDERGKVIHTTVVNGHTDQTVKVPTETPAGWTITKGQVPTEITFGPDGHADVTVTVGHQHVTVTSDQPKTSVDKLPDNPAKTYPNGVGHDDLNKTITRIVKVTTPAGQTKTVTQTAKLTRTADVDEVTGEVTYGQWTTAEWSSYDVPAVPGYTPSQREVPATKVTSDTKDQTVTVTYTANDQTTTINYVDERGKVIHTTVVNGHTDQTVKVPTETPAGWTITKGQVPTEIAFGPDGHADVTVTVGHQHVTVTSDQPKTSVDKLPDNPAKTYPNGVGHDDLNKTITRIVKVTTPAGQTKTVTQTAKLTRTADVDEVTGEVTYGQWTTAEWSSYDVPAVPGYTPSQREVPATKVTSDTKDQTVTVTYTANDQTTTINYVDERGKVIHTTVVNGHTDQTVKVPTETPAGWTITKGQVPTEIAFGPDGHADVTVTVGHQHVTVTSDQPKTSVDKLPDNPAKTYPNGVGHDDLNKTITRIVKVTTPAGQTKTVTQTAKLTRTADVDEVTGEVTYGQWTTAEWSSYDVPAVPGYTPSQREVPATKVTSDTKDQTVTVTYTANDQTTTINYVDERGKVIHTTVVNGHTDQTVKVPTETPAGWTITKGQVPTEIAFGPDGHADVTVTVGHQHVTVTSDQPKTSVDKLPDNPAKTYPNGVGHDDLNKTITRIVKVTTPAGQTKTVTQTAKLTRTADVDEVTGEVTYGQWTTAEWSSYDVPAVPGYTPSQREVPATKVTSDTKDQTVTVTYTANDQTTTINYVDERGKVIKSDTITGKTDQTVDVNVKVPDHYELVNGQNIPENVTLKANNPVINIQVTPKMDDITAPSQLTKAISRTITINVPHQTPIVEKQSANFTRTGQHNEVTGEDVYTGWTLKDNSLRHVDVPAIPGYTPSQNTVDGIATPAVDTPVSDITVNYKANEQTGQITYVDEKGNQISSTPLTGKTDEDIAINPVAPAGWELVPGQKYPATVTATADGIPGVTLTVRHHMINVVPGDVPTPGDKKTGNNDKKPGDGTPNKDITHEDLNKTITRTFIVKAPTGTMTKTQHISYQRTATIDDVTGDVTFSDWNTDGASFKAEVIPAISGYTSHVTEGNYGAYAPSQDQINNWTDPMITVTYTANDQSQVINYVDDHNKTIKTDTVHGKTDETVNVTPSVPDHYELVPGQNIPSEVTLKDKNTLIIVKVQPKVDSITDPAKLNKSISRTITINKPGEKPQVINQHADFTRTGQYNEVTGATVYTDWTLKGNTLEAVDAPAVPGYMPNVAHVDSVENPTADTKLANVVINYSADDQTQKIDYVDPNGKVVKTDTVKGKTDETVNVTPSVPDHYELVPGQNIPSEVTLKDKNTPIIVKVQPKVDSITDPAKLNKSISRTITINKPGEKPQVINQTATFKRTGKTNEVTGITTYTPWVLDQNGLTTVSAPEVPGYTPSQKTVASVDNPTTNTKLTDVTINYTANSQTTHINYVDKDGETVKSDTVSGKTDETVKTNSEVPAGWKITDGQIPETIHFTGEETPDTTITIEHDTTSVDHIKPVKPGDKTPSGKVIDGAHESDLNQTITRTINVTTPDGQTTTTKQVAKIFRDATIDDVTGEVTYGSWSEDTWADFKPGQLAGYTASQADVPAVTVKDGQKDQTVDITYTANEGTVLIKYVDRDGNEIGQQVITGHVGDTIKVTPQFPENWVPVDPDTVPAEVQIKEENGQIIIVVVRHDEKDPVQTKKVTRTIMVTTPDGQTKTIKQVVTISRHGNLDLVTGQIAWQPWTIAQWDVFKPAAIAGYIPSLAEVPAVTVDSETTDQTVDITYAAVATPAQPEHQAPTASDTPDAQQATNQKADSNAQPAVTVVTSQQTATAQQAESTTNSRRLPQTGNSHDASALAGLGLASLMGLFGLGGKRRKRD